MRPHPRFVHAMTTAASTLRSATDQNRMPVLYRELWLSLANKLNELAADAPLASMNAETEPARYEARGKYLAYRDVLATMLALERQNGLAQAPADEMELEYDSDG